MSNSIEHYLESSDAGKIIAHAKQLVQLSHLYQTLIPPYLAQISRLANYKSGRIVIHTASHAAATKLRQLEPTLTDGFSQKGFKCNNIQIKIQAIETKKEFAPPTQKPLGPATLKGIEGLLEGMSASPLRTALLSLLSRAARET